MEAKEETRYENTPTITSDLANITWQHSLVKLDNLNRSQISPDFECTLLADIGQRKVSLAEILACMIAILTVLENAIILIAIITGPRGLRKPPYWFIASLAAADFLTGIEVVLAIFVPVGESPNSRIALKGLAVVTFIISINSLLLVSCDRYLLIVHYADYSRILSRKRVTVLIAGSWLFSFLIFLIVPLLGWSCADQHCCVADGLCVCQHMKFSSEVCYSTCSQSFVPFSKSYLLFGVVYFIISILVMVFFYLGLFQVVRKKSFHYNPEARKKRNCKTKAREIQLAKTLIITLGIFVICWLPVMALFLVDVQMNFRYERLSSIFDYVLVPSIINSLCNPIIYSIRLPQIRSSVKRIILSFQKKDENRNVGTSTTFIERFSKRKSASQHGVNLNRRCSERCGIDRKPRHKGQKRLASNSELASSGLSTSSWSG